MSRLLSAEEQKTFWAELFLVGIRNEKRRRAPAQESSDPGEIRQQMAIGGDDRIMFERNSGQESQSLGS